MTVTGEVGRPRCRSTHLAIVTLGNGAASLARAARMARPAATAAAVAMMRVAGDGVLLDVMAAGGGGVLDVLAADDGGGEEVK